jgi:putative DNA primase/helicase
VTLRLLLQKTQAARAINTIDKVEDLLSQIQNATDVRSLESRIAKNVSENADISDTDREQLAAEIRKKANELGLSIPIGTIRTWLKPRISVGFPHLSADGAPLGTIENLRVLLSRMGATVRYNVISKQMEILLPGQSYTRDNQMNASLARVISEASRVEIPTRNLLSFLLEIADTNLFNPVAVWVSSKPWDGKSRINDLLATLDSPAPEPYKRLLVTKWLIQCIAAAFAPRGISPQGVFVLQGDQNKGKTRWLLSLAKEIEEVVLIGHTLDTKSKDSVLVAVSHWLVELGELDSTFSRSDISSLKAHVTQNVDKIRRPYAMVESVYERRTCYFGSVNDPQFLHDKTGNRRFWVLYVNSVNPNHSIDMQQLWAEVLVLWQNGGTYYLDEAETELLNSQNEEFTVADPIEERVSGAFDWDNPGNQWEEATATDILIRLGVANPTRSQTTIAANLIRKLNGNRFRRTHGRRLLAIPKRTVEFDGLKTAFGGHGSDTTRQGGTGQKAPASKGLEGYR